MNVLVIAPHPDDESIGCGGVICLHAARGDCVEIIFLTSGELGLKHLPREQAWQIRECEAKTAAKILGAEALTFLRLPDWFVTERVEEAAAKVGVLLRRKTPQIVYLPHAGEWHPDHRAALPVVQTALRADAGPAPTLLTYEVWTPLSEYDLVEDITSSMTSKVRAVRCYRSQLQDFHYDRAVQGLNQYRGALAGSSRYAEVFQSHQAWS
jgi:N-acetylglucosamine malate deacetylase 1